MVIKRVPRKPIVKRPRPADWKPASDKSVNYLLALSATRTPHVDQDTAKKWALAAGQREVSAKIKQLLGMPQVASPAHLARTKQVGRYHVPDGVYRKDGTIYKVYSAVHGSHQQVAKKLVLTTHSDGVQRGKFVYVGLAVRYLNSSDKPMTFAEAAKYGKIYGFCVVCGRTLTDEEHKGPDGLTSLQRGVGPVCAANRGWITR